MNLRQIIKEEVRLQITENKFNGPGLVVIGLKYTDDNRLQKFIDDKKYYGGIWNSRENYAFFPLRPDMLDALKSELSKTFKKMGIKAGFESQN